MARSSLCPSNHSIRENGWLTSSPSRIGLKRTDADTSVQACSHANMPEHCVSAEHPTPNCAFWLGQLTFDDLKHLGSFAESRLLRFGLARESRDDLVGKAMTAVLRGLTDNLRGRRPRASDMQTRAAFINFLRGAVASTVEAFARRAEHGHKHLDMGQLPGASLPTVPAPDYALLDLKAQLFKHLREKAPPRLHSTIRAWEAVFLWSDRVPSHPDSYHARAVRRLAREIILKLEPGILQTGKRKFCRPIQKRHGVDQKGRACKPDIGMNQCRAHD
jgi:hypothetical protein